MKHPNWLAAVVLPCALTACDDDATAPAADVPVQVAFASAATPGPGPDGELTLTGTNGTLVIEDVRMIVAEVELEGPEACVGTDDDDDDPGLEECEFESGPFLLDLPLGTGNVVVATANVPAGTYTELEFEVEDLDEDEDEDFGGALTAIRQQMRTAYPLFPDEASIVVRGTFTPTGGSVRPFTVYLDAEVEVERTLVPPLLVADGTSATTITVMMNPEVWFTATGGAVTDLSAFDGERLEFEAEFEDGVIEVEWGEDD